MWQPPVALLPEVFYCATGAATGPVASVNRNTSPLLARNPDSGDWAVTTPLGPAGTTGTATASSPFAGVAGATGAAGAVGAAGTAGAAGTSPITATFNPSPIAQRFATA